MSVFILIFPLENMVGAVSRDCGCPGAVHNWPHPSLDAALWRAGPISPWQQGEPCPLPTAALLGPIPCLDSTKELALMGMGELGLRAQEG